MFDLWCVHDINHAFYKLHAGSHFSVQKIEI